MLSRGPVGNRSLFTGREYDAESGRYHARARSYDPTLGRFLQRDPLGSLPDVNLYRYVGNNPATFVDPWGLLSVGGLGGPTILDHPISEPGPLGIPLPITEPGPRLLEHPLSEPGSGVLDHPWGTPAGEKDRCGTVTPPQGSRLIETAEQAEEDAEGQGRSGTEGTSGSSEEGEGQQVETPGGRKVEGHAQQRPPGQETPFLQDMDRAIDQGQEFQSSRVPGRKEYYDPTTNTTVVTSPDGQTIISARRGPPSGIIR